MWDSDARTPVLNPIRLQFIAQTTIQTKKLCLSLRRRNVEMKTLLRLNMRN